MRRGFYVVLSVLAGIVVVGDEIIKAVALKSFPDESATTGKKIIEFAVHKNFGIAFDLPVWLPVITILTVAMLLILIVFTVRKWPTNIVLAAPALIITLGAIGNLYDRIVYGFIVDYIIIPLTGSAFNLSDCLIIFGLLIFLVNRKSQIVLKK